MFGRVIERGAYDVCQISRRVRLLQKTSTVLGRLDNCVIGLVARGEDSLLRWTEGANLPKRRKTVP